MHYILAASTISHQDTFSKKDFSEGLSVLKEGSGLVQPNYKEFIDAGLLRRMSSVIKTSVYCGLDCIKQSGINEPEAIIVGTGLGCLADTEKFLNDVVADGSQAISPTPFIQSTHNTIAGQLSLILKNHNYNMTHTQNTLSFEHALQDGLLCLNEGKETVLLGAADEHIPSLNAIADKLNFKNIHLTSGASFFMLSTKKSTHTKVKVGASAAYGRITSVSEKINEFFTENNLQKNSVDLVLFSSLQNETEKELKTIFNDKALIDFQKYCGVYFSNSAFAVHLAADILERKKVKFDFMENEMKGINRILICNHLNKTSLGLTLIESLEA